MVASGVTVPRASIRIGISMRLTAAWPTVELAPPKLGRPPAGSPERLIRYQAPPARPRTTASATRLPSQRRRREGCGRIAGRWSAAGSGMGDDIGDVGVIRQPVVDRRIV